MPNNMTPQRVPLVEAGTTFITREWYRFLLDLYALASDASLNLTDLQVAPSDGVLTAQVAEMTKAIQDLQTAPPAIPFAGGTVMTVTATLNFPNTVAGAASDLTITVPGAVSGDVVTLGVPAASVPANGSFSAWVSAADTVTVRYANNSAATAYDPASGVFRAAVTRF